jgi:NO-binding membrane sensor protein with MHYT domain
MHFMAMLGFTVSGATIRYDVPTTAASAVLAIVVVGIGLFIAGFGKRSGVRIGLGGIFTGVGVAIMHYTGMGAMRLDGEVHYDRSLVIASVIIAVVAATVALWFTVTLQKKSALAVGALIMGVAVCGMHYTGMASMSVTLGELSLQAPGATAVTLLVPIALGMLVVMGGLVFAIGAAPREEDYEARAYLDKIAAQRAALSASTNASTSRRQGPATFQRSASSNNASGSFGSRGSESESKGTGTSKATRTT